MAYSQAQQEKANWFEQVLLPGLQRRLIFERFVFRWDPGIFGWVIKDRTTNKSLATIVGYGDKITTHGLKKTPRWLVNLAKKIHAEYPHDGIYINGKQFLPS